MRLKKHTVTIVVSSGSGTGVEYFGDEVLKQLCFTPPSATPTLDLRIVDPDSTQVFQESDITTPTDVTKDILFIGRMTISITNVSVDGNYDIVFFSYEPHG